ncbi:conserved hypothetical protein [Erythrobacter sp. EC-HK427]|nr:conserved hypothetical protein [Erythrobacter sp. EC-HK427]
MRLQAAGAHLLVRMVEPEALDWSAPFFRDAVPADAAAQSMQPYAAWKAAQNPPDPDYSDVAIIAHVARCGSTLLARNIAANDRTVVLSEPPFFAALHGRLGQLASEREALDAALAILASWRGWAKARGKRLVLKLSSQLGPFLPLLHRQMPGARFVLLHRDPLPVLESLARKRTSRLRAEAEGEGAGILPELEGLDADRYLLAAASSYLRAITAMGVLADKAPCIAYADLAARYPEICRALGLDPADAPPWNGAINAKARGQARHTPYTPVPTAELDAFAAAHPALLARLQGDYHRLCAKHPMPAL